MYTEFFRLKQEPFSIAPDPRFLFMSGRHREALAHLLYGLKGGGGFVLLSGEIGAGKTTVCRCFLEQVPKRCNVAYIFNPKLTVPELLKTVCDEFGIPLEPRVSASGTVKDYVDLLNAFLLKTHAVGQNNVLVIDEAQNLSTDVLEQLRLLTNLETDERKLLQIILIGQPELRAMLARPELEQLGQRVIARFHLEALSETETAHYIRHRLAVAGMTGVLPFDREARKRIHEISRGIPRRINLLCDRALLGAYAADLRRADRDIVDKAASEVFDTPAATSMPWWRGRSRLAFGLGALATLVVGGAALLFFEARSGRASPDAASPSAPASAPVASAVSATAAGSAPGGSASGAAGTAPVAHTVGELQGRLGPLMRDEREAWRALAQAWKLTADDGDVCEAALRAQLQCFKSSVTSVALIRQLDRPGILTLRDENDKAFYVLLTGLAVQGATVRGTASSQTVPLELLARLWRGDFATLWRAPPGTTGKVMDSNAGAAAEWLVGQLGRLGGAAAPASAAASPPAPAREQPTKARVAAFQLAHGLQPSGVAGPTTFMQLNRALGIDEPRLQAQR